METHLFWGNQKRSAIKLLSSSWRKTPTWNIGDKGSVVRGCLPGSLPLCGAPSSPFLHVVSHSQSKESVLEMSHLDTTNYTMVQCLENKLPFVISYYVSFCALGCLYSFFLWMQHFLIWLSFGGFQGHNFCFVFFSELWSYISYNEITLHQKLIHWGTHFFTPRHIFLWIPLSSSYTIHFSSHKAWGLETITSLLLFLHPPYQVNC